MDLKKLLHAALALSAILPFATGQSSKNPPDLTGVWSPLRATGEYAKFAPPAAGPLVLKPEYSKPYEARRAMEAEASRRGEPLATGGAQCIPYGVPTMMRIASYPVEILQMPKQITIIGEAFSEVRRVFMDKPQAPVDDVAPGYYGRSAGHWDGDTLVVDTIGIKPSVNGYLGMPHSEKMRVTERLKLLAPDVLHDQITIEDPVVLEKPVTYTLAFRRLPDYEMVEFVCDNNREYVDEKGIVRMRVKGQ